MSSFCHEQKYLSGQNNFNENVFFDFIYSWII